MLVKCKHYSSSYPDGGHEVGDIFDITKGQAEYYTQIGWVEVLPQELQPEGRKGKRKKSNFATDLSKSKHIDKTVAHVFK